MKTYPTVIAGDIGGTRTRLALYDMKKDRPELIRTRVFSSRDASGLPEMVEQFMSMMSEGPRSACFGIAGPVFEGKSKLTNLTWEASEDELLSRFNFEKATLINDLTALGLGVQYLTEAELTLLNDAPADSEGPVGIVAPGTGLGISLLININGTLRPLASEGGHVDFAPRTDEELELWRFLHQHHHHISVERVASGPGIFTIYQWLRSFRHSPEPLWLTERLITEDPVAVVAESALAGKDPICEEALDMFVSILGSVAGNLVLTAMTTGGIYLGGGVPPKILPKLREEIFMQAFCSKGRFRKFMEKVRVSVILEEKTGLLGAAYCAAGL
jgi:glucokinase